MATTTCYSSSSLILISSLLILAFAIPSTQAVLSQEQEVRDTTGKKLFAGTKYYMVPANEVGGLALGPNRHSYCPLGVVHNEYEDDQGMPVKFFPLDSKKGRVRISTDLNIMFDITKPECGDTTIWKLSPYDYEAERYFVTAGGTEGNPGCGTRKNWFKIEKYEDAYKLSFCPSVCKEKKVGLCVDLGIYVEGNGVRRLALSSEPFKIKFKKVYA
ncbi:hypothetical protein Sjap_005303 [Stephania japonica]|uniref:Uncharacterized protein n=1 Tax=Stephania japonica TaxID=461633 RepID=A0AAP0K4W4_9MAGN